MPVTTKPIIRRYELQIGTTYHHKSQVNAFAEAGMVSSQGIRMFGILFPRKKLGLPDQLLQRRESRPELPSIVLTERAPKHAPITELGANLFEVLLQNEVSCTGIAGITVHYRVKAGEPRPLSDHVTDNPYYKAESALVFFGSTDATNLESPFGVSHVDELMQEGTDRGFYTYAALRRPSDYLNNPRTNFYNRSASSRAIVGAFLCNV